MATSSGSNRRHQIRAAGSPDAPATARPRRRRRRGSSPRDDLRPGGDRAEDDHVAFEMQHALSRAHRAVEDQRLRRDNAGRGLRRGGVRRRDLAGGPPARERGRQAGAEHPGRCALDPVHRDLAFSPTRRATLRDPPGSGEPGEVEDRRPADEEGRRPRHRASRSASQSATGGTGASTVAMKERPRKRIGGRASAESDIVTGGSKSVAADRAAPSMRRRGGGGNPAAAPEARGAPSPRVQVASPVAPTDPTLDINSAETLPTPNGRSSSTRSRRTTSAGLPIRAPPPGSRRMLAPARPRC